MIVGVIINVQLVGGTARSHLLLCPASLCLSLFLYTRWAVDSLSIKVELMAETVQV